MLEDKPIVEDLMQLFDVSPDLILYKSDLLGTEQTQYIEEITEINEEKNLNPLDVVLESLINVLSEKLSTDTLTQSATTVYVDKSIQELAIQKIIKFVRNDTHFLEEIHKKWLERLHSFIMNLKEKGVQTLQEATFQVSMRFRISAQSSLKAMNSLAQSK